MANRSCRAPMKRLLRLGVLAATSAILTTACTGDNDTTSRGPAVGDSQAAAGNTLTIYGRSGESEVFKLFEQATGIKVLVRGGAPLDALAEQIIAEGADSPADVFYAPLSDALGLLSAAGRLAKLSDQQLNRVPEAYRSSNGTWVGTSGRALVVVYNTDKLSEDELPDSILGFTDPAWRGRIGWDPANRALQGGITALRQLRGEDVARAWLQGIQANAPAVFDGPRPITIAVAAGEIIEVGFGNHFYLYDLQAEGEAMNVAAKFYPGDPAGLLNVGGVGIIKGTGKQAAANAFVDFMLSRTAQQYFAEVNLEIPFVEGVQPPKGAPTANELSVAGLDVRQLEDLRSTRELLTALGIIM